MSVAIKKARRERKKKDEGVRKRRMGRGIRRESVQKVRGGAREGESE